jgi:hypothetical protein
MGAALLQRPTLDGDAARRPFRGDGRARLLAEDIRAFFRPLR